MPLPNKTICEHCRTKNAKAVRKCLQRRIDAGLCTDCGKRPPRKHRRQCQDCFNKRSCSQGTPESKQRRNDAYKKLRHEIISHYGGKCQCCAESAYNFLTIDHVNGDGGKIRKSNPKHKAFGIPFLRQIQKEGYPKSFQILCYNCNCSRGHYGFCH
jgi:hypothetical protein